MTIVASTRGDFDEAIRLWTRSRDLYTRLGNEGQVVTLQGRIDSAR